VLGRERGSEWRVGGREREWREGESGGRHREGRARLRLRDCGETKGVRGPARYEALTCFYILVAHIRPGLGLMGRDLFFSKAEHLGGPPPKIEAFFEAGLL